MFLYYMPERQLFISNGLVYKKGRGGVHPCGPAARWNSDINLPVLLSYGIDLRIYIIEAQLEAE